MIDVPNQYVKNLYKAVLAFVVILCLFFVVKVLSEWRYYQNADQSFNSITVYGYGEVFATPDIANVSFSIRKDAKTVKEAQDAVAEVEAKALEALKTNNVEDKDIKTVSASFNPKYEYQQKVCPQTVGPDGAFVPSYYCGGGKQVLVGYEAYENISVKVRDVDSVGKLMQDLGAIGVSDLSGPNFAIDDEDTLKAEAKKLAIEDARAKAKALAKNLGVKLGDVMSFYDDSSDFGSPMYYGRDMMLSSEKAYGAPAPAELPKGENMINSNVTITFEIR